MGFVPPPPHQVAAKAIATFAKLLSTELPDVFLGAQETVGWLEQELDRYLRGVLLHGHGPDPHGGGQVLQELLLPVAATTRSPVSLLMQCVPSWQGAAAHLGEAASDMDLLVFLTSYLMEPIPPQPRSAKAQQQRGLAAHLLPASVLAPMFRRWRQVGKRADGIAAAQACDGNGAHQLVPSAAHATILSAVGAAGAAWLTTYLRRLQPTASEAKTAPRTSSTNSASEARVLPAHVKAAVGTWRSKRDVHPTRSTVAVHGAASARARAERALDVLSPDVSAAEFLAAVDGLVRDGAPGGAAVRAAAVPQASTTTAMTNTAAPQRVATTRRPSAAHGRGRGVVGTRGGRGRGASGGGKRRRRGDDSSDSSDPSSSDPSSDDSSDDGSDGSDSSHDGDATSSESSTPSSDDPIQAIVRRHALTAQRASHHPTAAGAKRSIRKR